MLPAEIASGVVLEAFAATVTYRLEPNGQGTRFPLVLDHLLAGRLEPAHADAALAELGAIEAELRSVPARSVVYSLADLSRRDDPRALVNRAAADACGYFVAEDGRPLVEVLREGVLVARAAGRPLGLSTPRSNGAMRQAWLLLAVGVAWAAGAFVWLPRVVLVPVGATGSPHGPALWSLGVVAAAGGAVRLAAAKRPAFAAALRRHGLLAVVVGVTLAGALLALAWR